MSKTSFACLLTSAEEQLLPVPGRPLVFPEACGLQGAALTLQDVLKGRHRQRVRPWQDRRDDQPHPSAEAGHGAAQRLGP